MREGVEVTFVGSSPALDKKRTRGLLHVGRSYG